MCASHHQGVHTKNSSSNWKQADKDIYIIIYYSDICDLPTNAEEEEEVFMQMGRVSLPFRHFTVKCVKHYGSVYSGVETKAECDEQNWSTVSWVPHYEVWLIIIIIIFAHYIFNLLDLRWTKQQKIGAVFCWGGARGGARHVWKLWSHWSLSLVLTSDLFVSHVLPALDLMYSCRIWTF